MLIDCGMKKGSQLKHTITEVAENIRDATGGHLHLVVVTHEHEDHVSGFLSEREVFDELTIDKLWLAWTEDPGTDLANELRTKYKDTLLGLLAAAEKLGATGPDGDAATDRTAARAAGCVDSLLGFELSDERPGARGRGPGSRRSRGGRTRRGFWSSRASRPSGTETDYLRPHTQAADLAGGARGCGSSSSARRRTRPSLRDMDPKGDEEFHFAAAEERSFLAAFAGDPAAREAHQPFEPSSGHPASRPTVSDDYADEPPRTEDAFFDDRTTTPGRPRRATTRPGGGSTGTGSGRARRSPCG